MTATPPATTAPSRRHLWVDAGAGVAGDMLLGALVDAGADVAAVQDVVDAVLPRTVRLSTAEVRRHGMRALKLDVAVLAADQPHRRWADIRALLTAADVPEPVRARALTVFTLLAEAEARVHGVAVDDVHFHEVGAWDSVADVVGVAAAVDLLGVGEVSASAVAVGSGRIRAAHGDVPVPAPATLELARGWRVLSGGDGELATPTGLALVRGLAAACEDLPALEVEHVGVGAGTRDTPGRANVVRVVLGRRAATAGDRPVTEDLCVLEANVDDLDPRVWPEVLRVLLGAGAADAWLTPVVMKKGRPAHVLSALVTPAARDGVRDLMFASTTTFGVREHRVVRSALGRAWHRVVVRGHDVRVKLSLDGAGRVGHVTPELEDAAAAARATGVPLREVLDEAAAAARAAGLTVGVLGGDVLGGDVLPPARGD